MITNYSTLQTAIASWLNRSDMSTVIPTLIQLAEAHFRREYDLRRLVNTDLPLSSEEVEMPEGFQGIEAWYYDSELYPDPIIVVPADRLAEFKSRFRSTGVPRYAAMIDEKTARLAPAPSEEIESKLVYWEGVVPLSTNNPTNWLLEDGVDAYLYGALAESAPYLKDDGRVPMWIELRDRALASISASTQRKQWSGNMNMVRRRRFG